MIKIRVRKHRKQSMEKHRRMFMKRYAKIFVSCLLTFTMVFTSVQWSAIVNETTVVGAAETVPKEKQDHRCKEERVSDCLYRRKSRKIYPSEWRIPAAFLWRWNNDGIFSQGRRNQNSTGFHEF